MATPSSASSVTESTKLWRHLLRSVLPNAMPPLATAPTIRVVGGAIAGSAVRIAGGIGIVACAAVIALAAGGGNVFGGLGGLFGAGGSSLELARAGAPAADIVAAPTAAQQAALVRHSGA